MSLFLDSEGFGGGGRFLTVEGMLGDSVNAQITLLSEPTTDTDPFVISATADPLIFIHITCKVGEGPRFTVWDPTDGVFAPPFASRSTKTGSGSSTDPYIFTIYYDGRWPTGISIDLRTRVIDGDGTITTS